MTESRTAARLRRASILSLLGVLAVALSACAVYVPGPPYHHYGYYDGYGARDRYHDWR